MTPARIFPASLVRIASAAALAPALALALASGAAEGQGRCGPSYVMQPGDTLFRVAQKCRVGLTRIYELNDIDTPRETEVGRRLRLGALPDETADAAPGRPDSYTVEAGDTPYAVARALGVSLMSLLAENEELDPLRMAVGDVLHVPQGDRTAAIDVAPASGPPGTEVEVSARGLAPQSWVTVGAGRTASEWRAITDVRTAADGEVTAEVAVPGWTRAGDVVTFVVDTDQGVTLKSRDFEVTGEGDGTGGGEIVLEGRTARGVECMALTTPDGDLWSLIGDDVTISPGEYVEVRGRRAEMSFCQQGAGTVEVAEIEEVPAP